MSLLHLSGRKDARITQQAVRLVDFKELREKKRLQRDVGTPY